MKRLPLLVMYLGWATSANAEYGFDDGGFDTQAASVADYCYFGSNNCPTGSWGGTVGFIRSGSIPWGGLPADSPQHYAFVQLSGVLTKTFVATATGPFYFRWKHADRPDFGGQTYIVTINGNPIGTYSPTDQAFRRVQSAPFALSTGSTYTLSFAGQSSSVDRSALIDSVELVSAAVQTTVSYTYDAQGRLTGVSQRGGMNNGITSAYTYDKSGNRTRVQTTGVQ